MTAEDYASNMMKLENEANAYNQALDEYKSEGVKQMVMNAFNAGVDSKKEHIDSLISIIESLAHDNKRLREWHSIKTEYPPNMKKVLVKFKFDKLTDYEVLLHVQN